MSIFVNCKTQREVDELWEKLSAGGEKQRCGWLQNKYCVSWLADHSLCVERAVT